MKIKELMESLEQFGDYDVVVNMGQRIEDKVYILTFDINLDYSSVNMDDKVVNLGVTINSSQPMSEVATNDSGECGIGSNEQSS